MSADYIVLSPYCIFLAVCIQCVCNVYAVFTPPQRVSMNNNRLAEVRQL